MSKLKLGPEEENLFQQALEAAYERGSQNATFLANSMYQLTTEKATAIKEVADEYREVV